jgi:hypothetical protein
MVVGRNCSFEANVSSLVVLRVSAASIGDNSEKHVAGGTDSHTTKATPSNNPGHGGMKEADRLAII